jgi:hypothetical protein
MMNCRESLLKADSRWPIADGLDKDSSVVLSHAISHQRSAISSFLEVGYDRHRHGQVPC